MKRIHTGLSALAIALTVLAVVSLRATGARSQTSTGHEHHDMGAMSGSADAKTDDATKATQPTPAGNGKVALPGVPPGRPATGGGVTTTIVGEVMDPACFLEAGPKSIGKGHFQCAVDCVKSGQTLALYDRAHDRIYFVAGELPGRNPNEPLIKYIHQKVDVTGTVYNRSQAWGIVIVAVKPHVEKPSGAK